jgi:hypothetical protein
MNGGDHSGRAPARPPNLWAICAEKNAYPRAAEHDSARVITFWSHEMGATTGKLIPAEYRNDGVQSAAAFARTNNHSHSEVATSNSPSGRRALRAAPMAGDAARPRRAQEAVDASRRPKT